MTTFQGKNSLKFYKVIRDEEITNKIWKKIKIFTSKFYFKTVVLKIECDDACLKSQHMGGTEGKTDSLKLS